MLPIGEILDINMRGISAITLGVCGNYVGETLNCNLRKTLSENMLTKHLIVYFLIFIAMEATNSFGENKLSPAMLLLYTSQLYVTFILLSKTSSKLSKIIICILFALYFLHVCISYYVNDIKTKDLCSKLFMSLFTILYVIILVGVFLYIRKQKRDHGKDFTYKTFFLGRLNCDKLS